MRDYDWKIITTLYKTHSITKAAELLYMSQPALTKRVQIIEDTLGIKIVTRSQKGCEFTPEGQYIAEKAKIINSTIRDIQCTIASSRSRSDNMIRIGATLPFVQVKIPSLISQLQTRFHKIKFDIVSAYSNDLVQYLEEQSIDIGIVNLYPDSKFLINEIIGKNNIYAVYNQSFDVYELNDLPLIDFPKNPCTKKVIDSWWNSNFTTAIVPRYSVPTGHAAIEMVKNGLGFGFFPDLDYFQYEPNLYSIPLLQEDGSFLFRPTYLSYNKNSPKIETIRELTQYIRATHAGKKI